MEARRKELSHTLGYCQQVCNYCFNACLGEQDLQMMVECIKLDKACAEICGVTLSLVASDSSLATEMIKVCIEACQRCAEECKKHQNHHCQKCAQACEDCAKACSEFIQG